MAFHQLALDAFKQCSVGVVFCQWAIDPKLCHEMANHEIAVVTWVPGYIMLAHMHALALTDVARV